MPNKLAVIGATGRLGGAILEEVAASSDFLLENAYTHAHSSKLSERFRSDLEQSSAEIWLDVSLPAALQQTVALAVSKKIPLVIGSTGLTADDFAALKKASTAIAVFYTPNFSIGMALLTYMCHQIASCAEADFSIVETHRKEKKDAPSGSALLLASKIEQGGQNKASIHSIRAKEVLGEHEVKIHLDGEELILSHSIRSRKAFAKGALAACRFLLQKPAALYSMQDMLYT
jgi:4-hydroxy-tetrahydrodipicolinate reductase